MGPKHDQIHGMTKAGFGDVAIKAPLLNLGGSTCEGAALLSRDLRF